MALTEVIDLDPDFTLFPELPIELRLKIWEHAFPARVVNLIYDQYHDRFHSYNSSIPTLLHIHHETREMGLKIYQLCFGTESFEARIYFDFSRDILLFDDYLQFSALTDHIHIPKLNIAPVSYPEYPIEEKEMDQIQRVAVNALSFWDCDGGQPRLQLNAWALQKVARPIALKFPALREFNAIIECVDPFSRAPIRLFNVGSDKCESICDTCYESTRCQKPIEHLKKAFGEKLKIRLVGAYRGFSRFTLGCYNKVVEIDEADNVSEKPDPDYIPDVFESLYDDSDVPFCMDSDDEDGLRERREKYLKGDIFEFYEYEDVEMGFSDHREDDENADVISDEELEDIRKDESLYMDALGPVGSRRDYAELQGEWVHPDYFTARETL